MAILPATPYERLQPCLFDRLIDDDPRNQQESRNARIVGLARYREAVLRDIAWLLNSSRHLDEEGLSEFPEVERSVFNYGKGSLSGRAASGIDASDLENDIHQALCIFEPRIVPETLEVRLIEQMQAGAPNVLAFEIRGELWAQPLPEKLFIKTALDLETGAVIV